MKLNRQNESLLDEINTLEERIKQEILAHDQSEFAQENVEYVSLFYFIFKICMYSFLTVELFNF